MSQERGFDVSKDKKSMKPEINRGETSAGILAGLRGEKEVVRYFYFYAKDASNRNCGSTREVTLPARAKG